jgi:hypothetical protein
MAKKLFTEEWCVDARKAEADAADAIRMLFKDADTFTHVLSLEAVDIPGRIIHIDYVQGRLMTMTTELFDEERVWTRFSAKADIWRLAANGTPASNLIMGGKMKVLKGSMNDLVANAGAFNRLNVAFGEVDTDYSV